MTVSESLKLCNHSDCIITRFVNKIQIIIFLKLLESGFSEFSKGDRKIGYSEKRPTKYPKKYEIKIAIH